MKDALAGLGVAGLLCLPCVLVGGVAGVAVIGGALGALATNPLLQAAGLALGGTGAVIFWRARRRAACAVERDRVTPGAAISRPDASTRGSHPEGA